ncbi:short-chain dehydrogenase [Leptobacterium flavescens]|uniref:Short-chain dehydrogenase n=1 Tax=Leptobacterium flavescens TaxID=472055 RepID=A0A6P0ULV6_9FLAO|nr:short-chain dehydrogenase [Leptobacterium flavescens]NER13532.1 short-chain dehydrogenase [Leptobacterium flavescens]
MKFNLADFLFNTPLYKRVEIDSSDRSGKDFQEMFSIWGQIDIEGYNPEEKADTTFRIGHSLKNKDNNFRGKGGFSLFTVACKRYGTVFYYLIEWNVENSYLMKCGQYPSIADLHIGELSKYRKVISKEKLREFNRAIGLAANGVGIGSFVYLRRIFEDLINLAYDSAVKVNDDTIDEEIYNRARMDDRIKLLKNYLPNFLFSNREMYSILSSGIHELDESTCLSYFKPLKLGIEIILDEKLKEWEQNEKVKRASLEIKGIKRQLKEKQEE